MSTTQLVILISVLSLAACGKKSTDSSNTQKKISDGVSSSSTSTNSAESVNNVANTQGVDDEIIFEKLVKSFADLPLQATVTETQNFWSGDYWASNRGSINQRWNSPSENGFNLVSPTKEEVAKMSVDQLAQLSPAEKYDLLNSNYEYTLRNEVAQKAHKGAQSWEGICHGWAPASMNHKEPTPKLLTNFDGVQIPFGSSDIKALISYYYAFGFEVENTYQMGNRCEGRGGLFGWTVRRECKNDLNPGTFHIVLANRIGLQGKGFIADVDRFDEVWNHPIYGYKSEIMKSTSAAPIVDLAPDAKKRIRVKTVMYYIDESSVNTWEPLIGTKEQKVISKTYTYNLDLNDNNEIVGGKWVGKERPDFLWMKHSPAKFEGVLWRLGELLND